MDGERFARSAIKVKIAAPWTATTEAILRPVGTLEESPCEMTMGSDLPGQSGESYLNWMKVKECMETTVGAGSIIRMTDVFLY